MSKQTCWLATLSAALSLGQGCPMPSPVDLTDPTKGLDLGEPPPAIIVEPATPAKPRNSLERVVITGPDETGMVNRWTKLEPDYLGHYQATASGDSGQLFAALTIPRDDFYAAIFYFDAAALPEKFSRVEVRLFCEQAFGDDRLWLDFITSWWDPDETGGLNPNLDSAAERWLPAPRTGEWFAIDVTDYARSHWQNNPSQNHGFCLIVNGWSEYTFASTSAAREECRPQLVVIKGEAPAPEPLHFPLAGRYSPNRPGGYRFGDWWEQLTCLSGEKLLHTGTDFAAEAGDAVYAVADGEVAYAGVSEKWGGYVVVAHENDSWTSTYTHVVPEVTTGQTVERGQKLGTIYPATAWRPHLHFQVRNAPLFITWSLVGRLPKNNACVVPPERGEEPAFPERFLDSEELYWD